MDDDSSLEVDSDDGGQPADDDRERDAAERLKRLFEENPTTVFYGRQLEVMFESEYFHWITNRALRSLEGEVTLEKHPLVHASPTTLAWNSRYRYPRRQVAQVMELINGYVNPEVSRAVGDRGEELVLDGFAAQEGFGCLGRNVNTLDGLAWTETKHNLDFIFARDGRRYGVEVKNTLAYLGKDEFDAKIRLSEHLGLIPVFVCRALPKSWVWELRQRGGFSLIMRWQLYPPLLRELVDRLRERFDLPVDTPRRLERGTMARFVNWHERERGTGPP
jgi:hypothetical protein